MKYYIAVFKSRSQAMKFYDKIKKSGFLVSIINTPRQAGLGCGLSLKFSNNDLSAVSRLIALESLSSFGGIFKVTGSGHTLTLQRL